MFFYVFLFGLGKMQFILVMAWAAYLFLLNFSDCPVLFLRCSFSNQQRFIIGLIYLYCGCQLFFFLFQGWEIKFYFKSKMHICFLTFYNTCLFFFVNFWFLYLCIFHFFQWLGILRFSKSRDPSCDCVVRLKLDYCVRQFYPVSIVIESNQI